MPTYEFRCESCGTRFELFLSITASDPESCPECGRGPIKRLPSPGSGVIFKGAGFYATDYRPESYKKAERHERECSECTTTPEGKPSESGPANRAQRAMPPVKTDTEE